MVRWPLIRWSGNTGLQPIGGAAFSFITHALQERATAQCSQMVSVISVGHTHSPRSFRTLVRPCSATPAALGTSPYSRRRCTNVGARCVHDAMGDPVVPASPCGHLPCDRQSPRSSQVAAQCSLSNCTIETTPACVWQTVRLYPSIRHPSNMLNLVPHMAANRIARAQPVT